MTRLRNFAQTWLWPFPRFGWDRLEFSEKLKVFTFYIQAGAGMAMTAFAAYAMWVLATQEETWPVFYLGAMALVLVGVVVTGLAGLLVQRSVEAQVGPMKFSTSDAGVARELSRMARQHDEPTPQDTTETEPQLFDAAGQPTQGGQ